MWLSAEVHHQNVGLYKQSGKWSTSTICIVFASLNNVAPFSLELKSLSYVYIYISTCCSTFLSHSKLAYPNIYSRDYILALSSHRDPPHTHTHIAAVFVCFVSKFNCWSTYAHTVLLQTWHPFQAIMSLYTTEWLIRCGVYSM